MCTLRLVNNNLCAKCSNCNADRRNRWLRENEFVHDARAFQGDGGRRTVEIMSSYHVNCKMNGFHGIARIMDRSRSRSWAKLVFQWKDKLKNHRWSGKWNWNSCSTRTRATNQPMHLRVRICWMRICKLVKSRTCETLNSTDVWSIREDKLTMNAAHETDVVWGKNQIACFHGIEGFSLFNVLGGRMCFLFLLQNDSYTFMVCVTCPLDADLSCAWYGYKRTLMTACMHFKKPSRMSIEKLWISL